MRVYAARATQLSRPGHHRGYPRRPSAARSDRRQAAGTFTSATWLARAADRAWHCLSRTELRAWSHRQSRGDPSSLSAPLQPRSASRPSRHCGTGIAPDRDTTGVWRDVDEPCASLPAVPPGRARTHRGDCRLFDTGRRNAARDGLSAGGRWIRTSGCVRCKRGLRRKSSASAAFDVLFAAAVGGHQLRRKAKSRNRTLIARLR